MTTRKTQTLKQTASNDPTSRGVVFIDLEASGLTVRSWPVEVGWAFAEGDPASMLVRPEEAWPDDAWDEKAEALHGLSREMLKRDGKVSSDVCDVLNATLAGYDVYSDAPEWDAFWLYRLFGGVETKPAFVLRSYAELIGPLISGREEQLIEAATHQAPRRHRAAADALHLQTLYRLAHA